MNRESFMTRVIRVETVGRELKNLLNPLVISFSVSSKEKIPVSGHLHTEYILDQFGIHSILSSVVTPFFLPV